MVSILEYLQKESIPLAWRKRGDDRIDGNFGRMSTSEGPLIRYKDHTKKMNEQR